MSTYHVIYKFKFSSEEINNGLKIWAYNTKNLGLIDAVTSSYLSLPQAELDSLILTREYEFYLCIVPVLIVIILNMGTRCSIVVKALCYKPEDRGFDTR
jgi:hypothetical protein